MFTIGEFARLGRVSVRTLHHYERVGLLAPALVDSITGYRSYRAAQLPRLHRILTLKELGLPLRQIRSLLEADLAAGQLAAMLANRRVELADQIASDQDRLARVEQRLRYIQMEEDMSIDMIIKDVSALRVALFRWKGDAGLDFTDLNQFVPDAAVELGAGLDRLGVRQEGQPFLHYEDHPAGKLRPSWAVPIGSQPFGGIDGIEEATLPAFTAVVAVHRGKPDHGIIGPMYSQMVEYAEVQGYRSYGFGRDTIIGGEDGEVVIELQLPVRLAS